MHQVWPSASNPHPSALPTSATDGHRQTTDSGLSNKTRQVKAPLHQASLFSLASEQKLWLDLRITSHTHNEAYSTTCCFRLQITAHTRILSGSSGLTCTHPRKGSTKAKAPYRSPFCQKAVDHHAGLTGQGSWLAQHAFDRDSESLQGHMHITLSQTTSAGCHCTGHTYTRYAPTRLRLHRGSGRVSETPSRSPLSAACLSVLPHVVGQAFFLAGMYPRVPEA